MESPLLALSSRANATMTYKEIICATTLLLAMAHPVAANESLVIENVTVVSPEQPQPLGNRHVFIRAGRIEQVSDQPITAPTAVRRLDGTGKFLTPGIMDSHVHVSQAIGLGFGHNDPAMAALDEEFLAQQPRSYLYFGVTQLLDPSNIPEQVTRFAAQEKHPDIFRCGAAPVVPFRVTTLWSSRGSASASTTEIRERDWTSGPVTLVSFSQPFPADPSPPIMYVPVILRDPIGVCAMAPRVDSGTSSRTNALSL